MKGTQRIIMQMSCRMNTVAFIVSIFVHRLSLPIPYSAFLTLTDALERHKQQEQEQMYIQARYTNIQTHTQTINISRFVPFTAFCFSTLVCPSSESAVSLSVCLFYSTCFPSDRAVCLSPPLVHG